jgi:hypothetical protein
MGSTAAFCVVLAAVIGALSLSLPVSATNHQQQTGTSVVQVYFDSVQVDSSTPQAYSFGVRAQTLPTLYIMRLHWEFGDGSYVDAPYCCQSNISEVRYHAYEAQGTYTIIVVAFDSAGNFADATVTVSPPTAVPEYPTYSIPLLLSLFAVLATVAVARQKKSPTHRRPNGP